MEEGYLEGEICNRKGCKGIIQEKYTDGGCSCHIHPPCSYCETPRQYCEECGWDAEEEQWEKEKEKYKNYKPVKIETWEERQERIKKRYSQDDGKLYKIVRYFDSYREGLSGSNMKLGEALEKLDSLNRKDRYYVSYSLKEQEDNSY